VTFVLFFILGLFIGSFLNVLSDRLPRQESVIKGRSYCEKCKKTLEWYDLIPLLSFILLKGKCRYCKANLSFYYPFAELITGILFTLTAFFVFNGSQLLIFNFQSLLSLIYYLLIVSSLIVVFFTDLKYGVIPGIIIFFATLISFIYLMLNPQLPILPHLLSAVGAGLFFLALYIGTKKRGMGFGDVEVAFLMGLTLGFPDIVVSLYIAFLVGAIIGVIFIFLKKKKISGATIPFGPFLVLGTLSAIFWGGIIVPKAMLILGLR